MATTFKTLTNNDVTSTRTLLHEAIPITGTIVSGTYADDGNIKNYSHFRYLLNIFLVFIILYVYLVRVT